MKSDLPYPREISARSVFKSRLHLLLELIKSVFLQLFDIVSGMNGSVRLSKIYLFFTLSEAANLVNISSSVRFMFSTDFPKIRSIDRLYLVTYTWAAIKDR